MALNRDDYAIVVGIGHYPGLDVTCPDATAHAASFAAWLTAAEGGGLPSANVRLLLSAEGRGDRAPGPRIGDIHDALDALGSGGGGRAGRRLYAVFAGCTSGNDLDNLALLFADAGLDRLPPAALSLKQHREYLVRAGAFRQFVFLADIRQVAGPVDLRSPRLMLRPRTDGWVPQEFVAAGAAVVCEARATLAEASRTGPLWRLDCGALASRLRAQADHQGGWLQIEQTSPAGPVAGFWFGDAGEDSGTGHGGIGDIRVEVPHWTALVTAYDRLMRPVAQGSTPEAAGAGRWVSWLRQLPVGAYTVEGALGSSTARRSPVLVASGRTAPTSLADTPPEPKNGLLRLVTAAPLAEAEAADPAQTAAAVMTSAAPTWMHPAPPHPGRAGLFVFVRSIVPDPASDFADGLVLLDGDENVIIELAGKAVQRGAGWLAFNAHLPPGDYVLRREARSDARIRHQPLHLCAGWTAHVFLAARHLPALQSMALNVVPMGQSFKPDDRAAEAAYSLFEALRAGAPAALSLVESAAFRNVFDSSKGGAPWLIVLAAYVIQGAREGRGSEGLDDRLLNLLGQLDAGFSAHPDVRALRLRSEEAPSAAFRHPPMLHAGLRSIMRRATPGNGLVPAGSLTERVGAGIVADSPWTAWREAAPPSESVAPRRGALLANLLPAKNPVFQLTEPASAAPPTPETSATAVADLVADLTLVQAAASVVSLIKAGKPPEVFRIDPAQVANGLLGMVKPARVGAVLGLPVDGIKDSLKSLRQAAFGQASPSSDASGAKRRAESDVLAQAVESYTDAAATTPGALIAAEPTTIEECVATLRTEAAGLKNAALPDLEKATLLNLAARLEGVAGYLLRFADRMLVEDATGRSSVNGAMLEWLNRTQPTPSAAAQFGSGEAALREVITQSLGQAVGHDGQTIAQAIIENQVDGSTLGHVTVLRDRAAGELPDGALGDVDALLPRLTLHAALLVHGLPMYRKQYLDSLTKVLGTIEGRLGV